MHRGRWSMFTQVTSFSFCKVTTQSVFFYQTGFFELMLNVYQLTHDRFLTAQFGNLPGQTNEIPQAILNVREFCLVDKPAPVEINKCKQHPRQCFSDARRDSLRAQCHQHNDCRVCHIAWFTKVGKAWIVESSQQTGKIVRRYSRSVERQACRHTSLCTREETREPVRHRSLLLFNERHIGLRQLPSPRGLLLRQSETFTSGSYVSAKHAPFT